jgi:hypothetical protein
MGDVDGENGVQCRGCPAEIAFVALRSGRRIPVESADPEAYTGWSDRHAATLAATTAGGTVKTVRLVLPEVGDVLTLVQVVVPTPDGPRVLEGPLTVAAVESHFSTCPAAGDLAENDVKYGRVVEGRR